MNHKKIKWSVLLLILGLTAQAQQATTATGGNASGNAGTVAYSVGQVVNNTNTDGFITVSQGVQQAFEIFALGIKETLFNISLRVFPNPTTANLTLQISDYSNEKLLYQLVDMQGKVLNNGQIVARQTQINLINLPTATYFVLVLNQENKKVQSFKIIKN